MMRMTLDQPETASIPAASISAASLSKAACLPEAEPASRAPSVFWLSTLATAALALFAIYGGMLAVPSLTNTPAATAAPATPFGDFVQLAERLSAK